MTTMVTPPNKERENPRLGSAGLRFRSILVATDCSRTSEIAVRLAARFAKESHARLYVLHAILPELCVFDMREPVPEPALIDLQNARENLHNYVEHIPDLRTVKHNEIVSWVLRVTRFNLRGNPMALTCWSSVPTAVEGFAKLDLGSVAEWAVRRLPYPVLVTGPMCDKSLRPVRSVLLATDLSEHALGSAQYASSLAQDCNARLTVMNVLPRVGRKRPESSGAGAPTSNFSTWYHATVGTGAL